jgi:uncharacterized membrane protein YcaP (DUF421 family)
LVKELSQLNTSDIILILLISNSVQNAMVGSNNSLTGGLVAASTVLLINYILKKRCSNLNFKGFNSRKTRNTNP